jgi:hypothetical protein
MLRALNSHTEGASGKLDQLSTDIQTANGKLDTLNRNIKDASDSSGRLATALNWLTGVIGVAGVVLSGIALWHELHKQPEPLAVRVTPQVTVVSAPTPQPSPPSPATAPPRQTAPVKHRP